MRFKADKCYVLSMFKRGADLNRRYTLNGQILQSVTITHIWNYKETSNGTRKRLKICIYLGIVRGKLQCMFISSDSNNTINVNIDNTVFSHSSNIKILGVTIDECLIFNEPINIICSNAARQLNAIKRYQCNLDKESKLAIYRSYILSNFNYCPLVWHFLWNTKFKKYGKDSRKSLKICI